MENEKEYTPPTTPEEFQKEIEEISKERLNSPSLTIKDAFAHGIEYATVSILMYILAKDEEFANMVKNYKTTSHSERSDFIARSGDIIYQRVRDMHIGAHLFHDGDPECAGLTQIREFRINLKHNILAFAAQEIQNRGANTTPPSPPPVDRSKMN